MTRAAFFLLVLLATLALFLESGADAQSANKPECAPLHTLYKDWVSSCTSNGQIIPNADSDDRWKPCICKPGFFPLAVANEECVVAGSTQPKQVTASSLDALCSGRKDYTNATQQIPDPKLPGALASATSIAANMPTPTGAGSNGGGASSSASGMGFSNVLMGVASFAVVLATAAAL
ncbi:hypothetical protein BGX28_004851 [Mortierella sp. GBA30]|nr:hypothetical protein BGX28_004851 [Mortierella sp. GBA30]